MDMGTALMDIVKVYKIYNNILQIDISTVYTIRHTCSTNGYKYTLEYMHIFISTRITILIMNRHIGTMQVQTFCFLIYLNQRLCFVRICVLLCHIYIYIFNVYFIDAFLQKMCTETTEKLILMNLLHSKVSIKLNSFKRFIELTC